MTATIDRRGRLRARLRRLAEHDASDSFSILIPTHRTHPENEQDPIRFKNALDDAAAELEANGMRRSDVESTLEGLRQRLADRDFWQHRDLGFAVFGTPDGDPIELDVPVRVAPAVHVGNRFRIRPLTAALEQSSVPVLVLARGGVALFETQGREAHQVDCDLPRSVTDLNWFVDREPRLQQRTQPPSAVGGPFHGHAPEEDEHEDLRRYLDAIAGEIAPIVEGIDLPLIVAAPDSLAFDLSKLLDHDVEPHPAIDTDADGNRVAEAVDEARTEILDRHRSSIRTRYTDALGRGSAIDDLDEALVAGATGRIEALAVVPEGEPDWGRFDAASLQLQRHSERQPGDDDLVDRLIGLTLAHGGDVHPIDEPIDQHWFVAVPRYDTPTDGTLR